jgi:CelD/BcsL family acetyltransferase involved in cellulose biosynthesis
MHNISIHKKIPKSLIAEWETLWHSSPYSHFYNSPSWFLTYKKIFSPTKYLLITYREKNKLQVVIPLVHEKNAGVSTLQFPGGQFIDKSAMLYASLDKKIFEEIFAELSEKYTCYLHELPEELKNVLTNLQTKANITTASINAFIPLQKDPLRFLDKKQRSKIRNRIKKNSNDLEYMCYKGDKRGLDIAFEIDYRSTKQKKGQATFMRNENKQFFLELLDSYKDSFVVDVLSYKGNPFVYGIGLIHNKTYCAISTAYDDAYRHLLPGKSLLYYILNRLQAENFEIFDFLRGLNTLKKEFTPLYSTQYNAFYTKNHLVKYWWKTAPKIREGIVESPLIYNTYCQLKKHMTRS